MDFPIEMWPIPGTARSYLTTKDGTVRIFENGAVAADSALDIRDRVRNRGEQGLLGLAILPQDPTRVFLHYSAGDGDTVVAEYEANNSGVIDPDSERVLLRLNQPASNHNGGMLQFGPDGRLFLGLGDGGGANDRYGHGQNTDTLLGGLVAIDVDGGESELFSYGLRNPWRFWIEGEDVYIADVGQNQYEEVSVSPLASGANYGWPITEGNACFRPSSNCDTQGLTLPVLTIEHGDASTCSITGGFVYRGSAIPEIDGHYFYSDYCGGYLRSFRMLDGEAIDLTDWTDQLGRAGNVVGFGLDADGEMYVMTTNSVLKVVPVRG